jgi:hypothetical protein
LRGKRQLGRSRLVEENNIKMGMIKYGMAWTGLKWSSGGTFWTRNEPWGFIKCGKFLYQLRSLLHGVQLLRSTVIWISDVTMFYLRLWNCKRCVSLQVNPLRTIGLNRACVSSWQCSSPRKPKGNLWTARYEAGRRYT